MAVDKMIGTEILNYIITAKIGEGGMGSVYLGEHKFIGKNKVAIKVISADKANDFTISKLKEEATILTSLDHPNLVKFANYHIDEQGIVYLIMEFAPGIRLDHYVRTVTGPIPEEKICPVFEPILDGLGYAHKKNVLHRDIKPSNIMVTDTPTIVPKVLDFGIAGILNEYGDLNDGIIVGTPAYMSPEQVKGETLDSRSDIYSLGVMLHFLLTATVPYDTKSLKEEELNRRIIEEPLPRMKAFYPYVSDKMQQIVDKATAKDPSKRYQTCEEFKRAVHSAVYPSIWEKYKKWIIAGSATIAVIISALVLNYMLPKNKYYQDYIETWGVPQGVGKVSASRAKSMASVYKFRFVYGDLDSVAHVNAKGKLCPDELVTREDRPVAMSVKLLPNGKASKVKAYDQFGKCLYVKSYNEAMTTAIFQYDDSFDTEKTFGGGKITRWLLAYDEKGRVKKVQFAGFQNVRVGDNDGIYGKQYIRDSKGRVIEEQYLAFNDSLKATKWGLCKIKMRYDDSGNLVSASYLSTNDTPATSTPDDCINSYSMTYEKSNLSSISYRDAQDKAVVSTRQGAAGYNYLYEKGILSRVEAIGLDGSVVYCKDGYAKKLIEADQNGYVASVKFLDTNDEPCPSFEGVASYSYVNDSEGQVLKMMAYGIDGKPKETEAGYASTECKVDDAGNVVLFKQFGADGMPCVGSTGISGYKCVYNSFGLMTEMLNVGVDGNASKDNEGRMLIKYEYDTKGNVVKEAYYNESADLLSLDNNGVAYVEYTYDEIGNMTEKSYFDAKGYSVDSNVGFQKENRSYDMNNNPVKVRYFKNDHSLLSGTDYRYDERGNVIEEKPVTLSGEVPAGKHIIRYSFDSRDNMTAISFFNSKNLPSSGPDGYHTCVKTYNDRNQIVSEAYQNESGKLTKFMKEPYSLVKNEYSDRGEVSRQTYYDEKEKPVRCRAGYASRSMEYDTDNRISKAFYFDENLKPLVSTTLMPEMMYKYDKWGNQTYVAYADGSDKLIMNSSVGYSIKKSEYDVKGNVLEVSFYDEFSSPVVAKNPAYHKATFKYDERGNVIEEAYFDTFGKPMLYNNYARKEHKYDATSRRIEEILYDIHNQQTKVPSGMDDETSITLGLNYSVSDKVNEYSLEALPETYNFSDGLILTFSSISYSGGSCTASFSVNRSRYDIDEDVLEQVKAQINSSVANAKRIMKLSTKIKASLSDKNGNKIAL